MADAHKLLGQAAPAAATITTLGTVPASKSWVVLSLFAANRSVNVDRFRVAVVPSGGTLADQHYLYDDVVLCGQDTFQVTAGISMAAGDFLVVRSETGQTSFTATGIEIT